VAANFDAFLAHLKAVHTPSEDVGRIAQKAGVKTLVLSHLTPAIDSIDDETWRAPLGEVPQGRDHRRQGPDGGVRR
jgi:ribonuclease BN (tRNA processing enzyme)